MSETLNSEMEKLDVQGKLRNSCSRTHVLKASRSPTFFRQLMAKNHDIAVNNFLPERRRSNRNRFGYIGNLNLNFRAHLILLKLTLNLLVHVVLPGFVLSTGTLYLR